MVRMGALFFHSLCTCVLSSYFQTVHQSYPGLVSNHTQPFLVFTATKPTLCAMKCEELGQSECKAFNVKQNNEESVCELFHTRSYNITEPKLVNSTNGRYFERVCDGLSLRSAAKDEIDGQVIVTMIDVHQNVYQQREGRKLLYLGTVTEVFDGLEYGTDMASASFFPMGGIYLIRSGRMMNCFKMDPNRDKFKPCPGGFFPLDYGLYLESPDEAQELTYVIASYSLYRSVQYWGMYMAVATLCEQGLETGDLHLLVSERIQNNIYCYHGNGPDSDPPGLCPWEALWQQASGGVFLTHSRVCFFIKEHCYIFDFDESTMVEHHPVCKDEINDFLL